MRFPENTLAKSLIVIFCTPLGWFGLIVLGFALSMALRFGGCA